jgi:RHS repeat-associated protein
VNVAGSTKTFTYDANGNLTADGTRTFEWDAQNQLLAVNIGTHRSEFFYDGQQRRIRVIEKESSVVQSETKVVWCQKAICEERGADGTTVTKRALGLGEQTSGGARFFGTDHLGSLEALTDGSSVVVARYSYDPWGRRTLTAGNDLTAVGFTGHQFQSSGSLWLAPYRAYDSDLGRWVSLDPSGYLDGPNRYQYALGNPVNSIDPLGLLVEMYCVAIGQGAGGVRGLIGGLGFKHCFLRVKCDSCEKYDYRLEITGENPPGRADIPDPQGYSPGGGNLAGVIPPDNNSQNCENEDCLLKMYQGAKSRGRRYNMFGPNSNTFVEDLLRACGMKPAFPPGVLGNR